MQLTHKTKGQFIKSMYYLIWMCHLV